jgi:hypothetical protein
VVVAVLVALPAVLGEVRAQGAEAVATDVPPATETARYFGVRRGFWIEVSRGTGTVRNTCGGCNEVITAYGSVDYFRAGLSLAPTVLLGVEFFALNTTDLVLTPGGSPVDAENGSIVPIALWYVGRSGAFLQGGAGLARGTFSVRTEDGSTVTTKRTGSALTFGVGFDVAVSRRIAITASAGTNVMAIGDVRLDSAAVDDVIATLYEVSLGIALR